MAVLRPPKPKNVCLRGGLASSVETGVGSKKGRPADGHEEKERERKYMGSRRQSG